MNVNIRTTSGPVLEKPADLVGALTNQSEGDVLFIDEIHRLRPVIEEFLYPAMEDFRVEIRLSEGPPRPDHDDGHSAVYSRGRHHPFRLADLAHARPFWYHRAAGLLSAPRIAHIITRNAETLGMEISSEGARELAGRARGTPRIANRLLRRVRDFAQVRADGVMTVPVVRDALELLHVDEHGLDAMDTRVLETIITKFEGGPVGLSSLAVAIGEDPGTIEEVYEPFLIQEGLLMRSPRGRVATVKAYERLGCEPPGRNDNGGAGDPGGCQPRLL